MGTFRSRGVGTLGAVLAVVWGASWVGCGGGKPAKDANSEEHATPTDEPPPKWDTSSESADDARHPEIKQNESSDAPPPPQSAPQKQRRSDEYDKEATETMLKRATRQVKANCGAAKNEDGKAVGPWGKVQITINLGHNGHSKEVTVPAPYDGQPVGRCIVQAFSNLTFPPWAGADTTANWEVELVQPK